MSLAPVQTLSAHLGSVSSVQFAHCETLAASSSADASIAFYAFNPTQEDFERAARHSDAQVTTKNNLVHEKSPSRGAGQKADRYIKREPKEESLSKKGKSEEISAGTIDKVNPRRASSELSCSPLRLLGRTKGFSTLGFNDISFSPDDRYIATASDDTSACIWDIEYAVEAHKITIKREKWAEEEEEQESSQSEASQKHEKGRRRDPKELGVVGSGYLGTPIGVMAGHRSWVIGCRFDRSGSLLLTYGFDETARLFDVRSTTCVRTLRAHMEPVSSSCFVDINNYIVATASLDGSLRMWDIRYNHVLKTFTRKNPTPILDLSTNYSVDVPRDDFLGCHCYMAMNVLSEDSSGGGTNSVVIYDADEDCVKCELPLRPPGDEYKPLDMIVRGGFFGVDSVIGVAGSDTISILPLSSTDEPQYIQLPKRQGILSIAHNSEGSALLVGMMDGDINVYLDGGESTE